MARECSSDPQCEHVMGRQWRKVAFWLALAVAFAVFWMGLALLVRSFI